MTSITWAGPRCVQEAAAILGSQNRTQGRCVVHFLNFDLLMMLCMFHDAILKNILGDKNILLHFCLKIKVHFLLCKPHHNN